MQDTLKPLYNIKDSLLLPLEIKGTSFPLFRFFNPPAAQKTHFVDGGVIGKDVSATPNLNRITQTKVLQGKIMTGYPRFHGNAQRWETMRDSGVRGIQTGQLRFGYDGLDSYS